MSNRRLILFTLVVVILLNNLSGCGNDTADGKITDDGILFPCEIPGTDLVAEELSFYEGPFLEDGSYEEVCDVAALVVRNTSESMVFCTQIQLHTRQQVLFFTGTWIPPGEKCVLLEINRSTNRNEPVISCTGTQELRDATDTGGLIRLEEKGDTALCVVNCGEKAITSVKLRYKTFLQQTKTYMGGITEEATVTDLFPGEARTVHPYRYVSGYSGLVAVCVDE